MSGSAPTEFQTLRNRIPATGKVNWIGISSTRRADIQTLAEVEAAVGTGLRGDHHAESGRSARQVTLLQAEHLEVLAALLEKAEILPEQMRRNLVISGINLRSLKDRRFKVGEVLLEGSGECPPCSRMEETLGEGGYQAARGHGGITARVLTGGTIRVGAPVQALESAQQLTEQT